MNRVSKLNLMVLIVGTLGCGLVVGPALALPVIQEVYYDGPGGDADDVFTEIYGTPLMSLDGYSLVGINGASDTEYRTILLDGMAIPADGVLVIATDSAVGTTLSEADYFANVDWQNGAPDAVQLRQGITVIDALQYGSGGVLFWGEGTAAPDASSGSSLSRDPCGNDTDDNSVDFFSGAPTPGVCDDNPIANTSMTWGAIKALY